MRRLVSVRNCVAYHVSHCLLRLHTLPHQLNYKMLNLSKAQLGMHCLKLLSYLILIIALSLGLYMRWTHTGDITILVIGIVGLFLFLISCALTYYFSLEHIGSCLTHLWIGCLLGMIAFTESELYKDDSIENIVNVLLMISLGLHCAWVFGKRLSHLVTHEAVLLTQVELLESLGMIIASILAGHDFVSIALLAVAFSITLIAVRTKSLLSLINLLCLGLVSKLLFFPAVQVTVNVYALSCFIGRMSWEPIIDLYFSNLTVLERWQAFLGKPQYLRRLCLLLIAVAELSFIIVTGYYLKNHKESIIVIPIYVAFIFIWLGFHVVFFITAWQLMNKITDCNSTFSALTDENGRNLTCIMASKGVRHFALVSQRLVLFTILTTLVIPGIGWTTRTGVTISMVLIVLPLECMMLSLLWELGSTLGGTCTGYALVAPATYQRLDGSAQMSANVMQELGTRSTQILNFVQRFFAFHMINTFGCDYSSSGITTESLLLKLKAFFEQRTTDGPRYDTYMVYYSGQVQSDGNWALAANGRLTFENLLELWRDSDTQTGSRLILVLDTGLSNAWCKPIRKIKDENVFVALQTCKVGKLTDPEKSEATIGDFTQDWVDYNCGGVVSQNWHDTDRQVKALYSVSRYWTDFTFHLPTSEDFSQHWESNFPKLTRYLIKAINLCPNTDVLWCCCYCIYSCLKRKKMSWFPPQELDTGHGFKLIRS